MLKLSDSSAVNTGGQAWASTWTDTYAIVTSAAVAMEPNAPPIEYAVLYRSRNDHGKTAPSIS